MRYKVLHLNAILSETCRRLLSGHDEARAAQEAARSWVDDNSSAGGRASCIGCRGSGFEGKIARTDRGSAIETENIARIYAVHEKRKAHSIAGGEKVRSVIDVSCDVVWSLSAEGREQVLDALA